MYVSPGFHDWSYTKITITPYVSVPLDQSNIGYINVCK